MKARVLLTLLVAGTLFSASPRGSGHHPIEIKTSAAVCFAPCDLRVIARIEPHPLNRWWVLVVEGGMFDASEHQLDGEKTPPTQDAIWYKALSPGDYQIVAVVYRAQKDSEAGRATATLHVIDWH